MLSSIVLVMALQQPQVSHQFPSQLTTSSAAMYHHQRHVLHLKHLAHLRWLAVLAAAPRRAVTVSAPAPSAGSFGHPNFCGDGDGDGWDVPCGHAAAAQAPVSFSQAPVTSPAQIVSAAPGSFQACVIRTESGGNARAVNASSGAGGLYQFLPSTWASLGYSGLPQNAPISVQNAAFQRLFATAGTSPWAPSDGC